MIKSFVCSDGEKIIIDSLTRELCYNHYNEILELINTIPHIKWDINDLFHDEDYYGNKWSHSFVIINCSGAIVGVLIAYVRIADKKHILDSLYIHKLAIQRDYQNKGIGSKALECIIQQSFRQMQWLLNITVQTNDCSENEQVLRFYEKNGFSRLYNIQYPNKTDILMIYERKQVLYNIDNRYNSVIEASNYYHPRLNYIVGALPAIIQLPVVYFSSTNIYKKNLVQFILHNYNINVTFVGQPFPLTEPQLECADPEEELNLVRFPLKFISRFINNVPYVVEDSMLFIEFFNRNNQAWELPGADTKRWWRQLGAEGLLSILGDSKYRKAKFVSQTGAYIQSNEYYFGRGELGGTIADSIPTNFANSPGTYPCFFHKIFIPDGANRTLAEMDTFEFAQYDYIRKSLIELINQLSKCYDFYNKYTKPIGSQFEQFEEKGILK